MVLDKPLPHRIHQDKMDKGSNFQREEAALRCLTGEREGGREGGRGWGGSEGGRKEEGGREGGMEREYIYKISVHVHSTIS